MREERQEEMKARLQAKVENISVREARQEEIKARLQAKAEKLSAREARQEELHVTSGRIVTYETLEKSSF